MSQPSEQLEQVIIVGAGMAGLAAANKLVSKGVTPLVLEANPHPGGRTYCLRVDDGVMAPTGAAFMVTSYRNTKKLIQKFLLPTSYISKLNLEIFINGKSQKLFEDANPLQVATTSLLNNRLKFKILASLVLMIPRIWKSNIYDHKSLLREDNESVYEFSVRNWGRFFADNVVDPVVFSIFNYSSKDLTKAFIFSALKETIGHKHFIAGDSIDHLAKELANSLSIRYSEAVEKIIVHSDKVEVVTNKNTYFSEKVILALPGPLALLLVENLSEIESNFLSKVKYLPYQSFLVSSNKQLIPGKHLVFPASESIELSTIIEVEVTSEGKYYYQIVARTPLTTPDIDVSSKLEKLNHSLMGKILTEAFELVDIVEWRHTIPVFYPGYLNQVDNFNNWQFSDPARKIIYAGDYLMAPYIEGAVTTGLRAADWVLKSKHGKD